MKDNKKVILLVLDGVGINKAYSGNAVTLANMPTFDLLKKSNPYTKLGASEKFVGLPEGQMGSSEVGHSTFGAGRIMDSEIVRINKEIKSGNFAKNKVLTKELKKIKGAQRLHLVGLLSDGGIHSHKDHFYALLDIIKKYNNISQIYLHLFTDGRDTDPKSGQYFLDELLKHKNKKMSVASISGRYYGMDRDNHWDRLKKVYDLLVYGKGSISKDDPIDFIENSYNSGITDEFLEPTLFDTSGIIKDKDTILFFNFRSDRARQFTKMFVDKRFDVFNTKKINVNFVTLTEYDSKIKNLKVMYPPEKQQPGLGQIISKLGYKQLRLAETEKFAHVTYFFNLGQEKPNKKEDRILVPSPGVLTYDKKPEMSVKIITQKLIENINKDYKFILVNFANGDMVGHTGNIKAAIKALETIDQCLSLILKKIDLDNTILIITADHGNCDVMLNKDGSVNTAHSLNKVPFIIISKEKYNLKLDKEYSIANIAPTILKILDLKVPNYMEDDLLE